METLEGAELCFPQLLNSSCRKPTHPNSGIRLFHFLPFISVLTAALNLLVIISISHFRQRSAPQLCKYTVMFTDVGRSFKICLMFILIMIFSHCRQLHTTTNFLLLSLAVSDIFVGFVLIPVDMMMGQTCWFLGDFICAAYYLFSFTIIAASVYSMVLISVDRYVAICFPLHYPTRVTVKSVTISISLCWITSIFLAIIILYENLKVPGKYNACYGECVVKIPGDVDLVFTFIIPISVIITLYMRVFVVAVSQARAMRSHITAVSLHRSKIVTTTRSELKAARTLGILVVVFLMCYCPNYCLALTGGTILIGSSVETSMVFLMYFNSCLNPVIYAFFYPWFRKAIRLIVTLQVMQPGSCEANIL